MFITLIELMPNRCPVVNTQLSQCPVTVGASCKQKAKGAIENSCEW